jgi:hypothetical protein
MALAVGQCPSASGFENEAMSNVAIKSYNRIAIETLLRESSSLESQLPCRTATMLSTPGHPVHNLHHHTHHRARLSLGKFHPWLHQ